MKKITTIFSVMALAAVFSTNALAQGTQKASATATATTEVITPIAIEKAIDLNFGVFSTDGATGSILLTPAESTSPTISSGITLTTVAPPTAAKFNVSGDSDYAYTIELPGTITLTGETPANTMTISDFTSSIGSDSTKGALVSGVQTVYVGGTLNVPEGTKKDVYSNTADLTVTVVYN